MTVTNDKLLLLKSHECSNGLSDEALKEISDAAELVRCDSGELLSDRQPKVPLLITLRSVLEEKHESYLLGHAEGRSYRSD